MDNENENVDIDKLIDEIVEKEDLSPQLPEIKNSEQNLIKMNDRKIDVSDEDNLAEEALRMMSEDRSKADKIFDLFYADLSFGKDRSQASKEALARALELKIESGKGIIEILKLKAKKKENTGTNILINTVSEKKAGISMNNMEEFLKS